MSQIWVIKLTEERDIKAVLAEAMETCTRRAQILGVYPSSMSFSLECNEIRAAATRIRELESERDALKAALSDMLSGWIYIRKVHGDLPGVGWDRAQNKAEEATR